MKIKRQKRRSLKKKHTETTRSASQNGPQGRLVERERWVHHLARRILILAAVYDPPDAVVIPFRAGQQPTKLSISRSKNMKIKRQKRRTLKKDTQKRRVLRVKTGIKAGWRNLGDGFIVWRGGF